jgi:hypothetical protein
MQEHPFDPNLSPNPTHTALSVKQPDNSLAVKNQPCVSKPIPTGLKTDHLIHHNH